jgi:hypothetical protein
VRVLFVRTVPTVTLILTLDMLAETGILDTAPEDVLERTVSDAEVTLL